MRYFLLIAVLLLLTFSTVPAQDSTTSMAVKKNTRFKPNYPQFYQPDLSYQLWQNFSLNREANAGNPDAMHELGIRYLFGNGVAADTVKAAYWVKRAADAGLTSALFNYGLFLLNGLGIDWNPFEAFTYFEEAAQSGMPAAQYVAGAFYTDNLVVQRDYTTAVKYLRQSAEAGYEPASELIDKLKDRLPDSLFTAPVKSASRGSAGSTAPPAAPSGMGLVYLNFDAAADTAIDADLQTLINDLSLVDDEKYKNYTQDSLSLPHLTRLAENGSPEAMTLLGMIYSEGLNVKPDNIKAYAYYIRAARLDSYRARWLLWQLQKNPLKPEYLRTRINNSDAEAMFVWYGLNALQFDNSITQHDALNLLKRAADAGYIPALLELGVVYFSGKPAGEDKELAVTLWSRARSLGSREAEIRIEAAQISGYISDGDFNSSAALLQDAEADGSLLAQAFLAYAYETGKGVNRSIPQAVKFYSRAAQRGSRFAYDKLRSLFDNVRPEDPKFSIN